MSYNPQRHAQPCIFDDISCSQCGHSFGAGNFGYSHCDDHRQDTSLDEAFKILNRRTSMLPTREHLDALHEHYQSEILKLVYDIEQVTKAALKRN